MNNSEILGEEAAVRQIVEDDFSATNGVFEDDSVINLRESAFRESKTLKSLILPNCVKLGSSTLNTLTNLKSVSLPKLKTLTGSNFYNVANLKELVLPSLEGSTGYGLLRVAPGIIHVDLGLGVTDIAADSLTGYICDDLILRNANSVVKKHIAAYETNFVGHVYVPRELVASYQNYTNWSAKYAEQTDLFRALEDYTVDGTITGELNQTLANPEIQPVYTLSDQYFNGTSTYIDTGVKLFDTDGKFTILMKFSSESAMNPGGREVLSCYSESLGSGYYLANYGNSYATHINHFRPDGSTNAFNLDGYSNGEYLLYVRSSGLKLASGNFDFNGNDHRNSNIKKTGTLINHSNNLILGAHYNDNTDAYSLFWKGTMHKVKVYKAALSGHQILKELNSF